MKKRNSMAKTNCIVGRDDDNAAAGCLGGCIGIMMVVAVVVFIIMAVVSVMCTVGAIIGMFSAIGNYFASLKENLIDSNRRINNI